MTIFDRILEVKREEVRRAKSLKPISELRRQISESSSPVRGFVSELQSAAKPVALIAEVKKASPSKGVIVEQFDPKRIAAAYAEGGAHCLSVLTDSEFFQGSPNCLEEARREAGLPVLRKDFIVDEYQLFESRAMGADCILLIVSAFGGEPSPIRDLRHQAEDLGMDVLVEVHDEWEMECAARSGATFVGINNRDLKTFKTDLGATDRVAKYKTTEMFLVSESAIRNHQDVLRVSESGARAILVGESLASQRDIVKAVKELMGW